MFTFKQISPPLSSLAMALSHTIQFPEICNILLKYEHFTDI